MTIALKLLVLLDTEELQAPNLSGENQIHQHSCAHFSAQFVLFFNPSRKVLIENMQPQTQKSYMQHLEIDASAYMQKLGIVALHKKKY